MAVARTLPTVTVKVREEPSGRFPKSRVVGVAEPWSRSSMYWPIAVSSPLFVLWARSYIGCPADDCPERVNGCWENQHLNRSPRSGKATAVQAEPPLCARPVAKSCSSCTPHLVWPVARLSPGDICAGTAWQAPQP